MPRDKVDCSRLVALAKAESVRAAERTALRNRISAAITARASDPNAAPFELSGSLVESFATLARLACYATFDIGIGGRDSKGGEADFAAEDEQALAAARDFMRDELDRKATPESARGLLVSLGVNIR